MRRVLLIPSIKVHNANALSSPYTIGFPAMTAWLGAMHALQRKINQHGFPNLIFKGIGVVCHDFNLQAYKGKGDFVYSLVGTANPLNKEGKRSAFIEEARCHLVVSFVIECVGFDGDDEEKCLESVNLQLRTLKLAGGDVIDFRPVELLKIAEQEDLYGLIRKLMPGYAMRERRDLMVEAMQNGQDAIDAMLDYLKIAHRSEKNEKGKVSWASKRKTSGWIVPIATGFHGISPVAQAKNQRDPDVPHRFAESVVTLGEFIMPYHIEYLDQLLWVAHADIENNLYLCQQNSSLN